METGIPKIVNQDRDRVPVTADIEKTRDVGMLETGQNPVLALEPLDEVRSTQASGNHLDRYTLLELAFTYRACPIRRLEPTATPTVFH